MKRFFISVPAKLLLLIMGTLLLVGVGSSTLSLSRLQKEIQDFQQQKRQQGQQQLLLHHDLFSSQLRTWLESFSSMIHLSDQTNFTVLADQLAAQLDTLEINFNVNNLWVFDKPTHVLFATNHVPDYVVQKAKQVFDQQEPYNIIYCVKSCQQLVLIPVLNKRSELAVIGLSSSLVDVLYGIKGALKSEVAVVSYAKTNNAVLGDGNFISSSNSSLSNAVFKQLQATNVAQLIKKGSRVDVSNEKYFLTLTPLAENNDHIFYLALIDNVSEFIYERDHYRQQFIVSIVIVFFLLGFISYLISAPFTKRLLMLSNALPLLAQKKFDHFRQIKLTSNRRITDELDILVDSAKELSFELERLNIEVEHKTQELENIAMFDLLTGLPNRNMLNYQLRKALENIKLTKKQVAVLFLDLDDFKKVNDSHGHSEGDELLIEAALRLKRCVRKIDLVSRFGGDEFVIILQQINNINEVVDVAKDIIYAFKLPISVSSSLFYVSTSIGIVCTADANVNANDLIRQADIAMYEAKDAGGGQYFVYHTEMFQRVAQRVMIEAEVRQALQKNQFSMSLQPQISTLNYEVVGFEALLRWHHPERGMVSPDDFIPVLESSAYMVELGYWVIRRCFSLTKKITQHLGLHDCRIAINLSAIQFVDPKLVAFLQALLVEFNLTGKQFELEITEQTLVKNVDNAVEVMLQLKELGFSFAIDDFGTGYSSLSYLKKLPIDVIKIDKSFVFGMLENHADYQIIMSTISMVKNLGLTVVAEGVESSAQFHSLKHNQCDSIQGYYFSKPVPEADIEQFIAAKIVRGHWKWEALKPEITSS